MNSVLYIGPNAERGRGQKIPNNLQMSYVDGPLSDHVAAPIHTKEIGILVNFSNYISHTTR